MPTTSITGDPGNAQRIGSIYMYISNIADVASYAIASHQSAFVEVIVFSEN